ncbi:hypothetical protein CLOSTASPAR_05965 [[Clostridium] asparagiforme DSM 15981]|uniref:Uncharacterized protein n=1 Tax=[Clostridium] asparagiforme DSM 15981 TaxID=518636 RepID=C0D9L5_9FIRM|nr:hypothetical protein CLOSTASPAR_05965 [[Clostridium] asparagiforme DSM 15981]
MIGKKQAAGDCAAALAGEPAEYKPAGVAPLNGSGQGFISSGGRAR